MLTIKQVIRTLYNALIQKLKNHRGNWEQNDPTADDYIKNRPFYTDETNKETVVKTRTFTATNPYWWGSPFAFIPIVEEAYKVTFDDKEYICIGKIDNWGGKYIGNISIDGDGLDTGEPFFYYWYDSGNYNLCVRYQGQHTITIEKIKVEKLDKRYLPDLDLAPVATSGSYYDLEDAPIVYNDVVRYDVSQGLSSLQKNIAKININAVGFDAQSLGNSEKAQARSNIGAVGYEAQTLTDAQKTQARSNIGAGTGNSDFSGSYNDLIDKPEEIIVDKALSDTSVNPVQNKIVTKAINNLNALVGNTSVSDQINNAVANLVDSAPETLDTLGELATALQENQNVVDAVNGAITNKVDKVEGKGLSTNDYTNEDKEKLANLNASKDSIALIDQVNGCAYILCMREGNLVTYCITSSIEVTTMPTKTEYYSTEHFDPAGMVITATAEDGTTKEITDYTYSTEALTEGQTSIEISYTEANTTYTVSIPIIVKPFTDVLVDFEYTNNGDGTYTITGWKGTYNGEPSTEMIIPNYENIIV